MKPVSDYLKKPMIGGGRSLPVAGNGRQFALRSLDELRMDHLTGSARERYVAMLEGARAWRKSWPTVAGMSFVVTGPAGTGKTTVAENLRAVSRAVICAVDWDNRPIPGTEQYISNGRFTSAAMLMRLLDPAGVMVDGFGEVNRSSLETMFGRADLVVVDDLGREELPYVPAGRFVETRQNRYREFFDWLYRRSKSVIVTSNVPLLVAAGATTTVNPAFIEIIGEAAWSRLEVMAAGYMFDLTGVADYRRIEAKAGRIEAKRGVK